MQCDDVARILPEAVDGGVAVEDAVQRPLAPGEVFPVNAESPGIDKLLPRAKQ